MKYHNIYKHYEGCLAKHLDGHLAVDWPNMPDLEKRFSMMLNVVRESSDVDILDFGCGNALLYSYLKNNNITNINYSGLDISKKFISTCKSKYPEAKFYCKDILREGIDLEFDYAICNGTFTEKLDLTFDEMFDFFSKVIGMLFHRAKSGIAFNVMSSHVDYERSDLFHVPHDLLASYLCTNLSRDYIIRNDYGLYEYTVYLYKGHA